MVVVLTELFDVEVAVEVFVVGLAALVVVLLDVRGVVLPDGRALVLAAVDFGTEIVAAVLLITTGLTVVAVANFLAESCWCGGAHDETAPITIQMVTPALMAKSRDDQKARVFTVVVLEISKGD